MQIDSWNPSSPYNLNDFGKINNAYILIYKMGIKLYNYIM